VIDAAQLTGVMCATVTPMAEDGFSVCWDGVRSNAEWLMSQPISVVVVNGSIGEYAFLSSADRSRAVRETVEAVAGRALVVAGCSSDSPTTVVQLSREAAENGADAIMLLPPHYFRLSPQSIEQFFRYVDENTSLPFIVYNNPSITGFDLTMGTVAVIADMPRFLAYKEASPQPLRYFEIARRLSGRPVIPASESVLFFCLASGASACMTSVAAFAPSLLARMLDAFATGDVDGARTEFARLHAYRSLLQPDLDRGLPAYIAYTKAAMNILGLTGGRPHFPLPPLDEEGTEALRKVLTEQMGLSPIDG